MKKNKIMSYLASLMAIIAIIVTTATGSKLGDFVMDSSLLSIEATASPETGSKCKWKLVDCPGLGKGDYEACLENGDGNSCSCGTVSRNCPK